MSTERERRFLISEERVRAYSRRGNYHSDPETATALGLPGLVAQGVQALGPAYGALLDEWGDDFLDYGALEVTFVGMVLADEEVVARVTVDGDTATITVDNATRGHTAVVGHASR